MAKRYTRLPLISAEISVFVELRMINNASSSEESIVLQNWDLQLVEWLNSLGYKVKVCKFAVLHALHVLILLLELFWRTMTMN